MKRTYGCETMKNKKLFVFNIIILLLFVSVVIIGHNTWGAATMADANSKEQITEFEAHASLRASEYTKKKRSDVTLFGQEKLEIIELAEEESLDQENEEDSDDQLEGVTQPAQESTQSNPVSERIPTKTKPNSNTNSAASDDNESKTENRTSPTKDKKDTKSKENNTEQIEKENNTDNDNNSNDEKNSDMKEPKPDEMESDEDDTNTNNDNNKDQSDE